MNTEKKYGKHLTAGEWVRYEGNVHVVQDVRDYGNGWFCVSLSDGIAVDCLGYRTFDLA